MYLIVALLAFFVGDLTAKSLSTIDAEKVEVLEAHRAKHLNQKQ